MNTFPPSPAPNEAVTRTPETPDAPAPTPVVQPADVTPAETPTGALAVDAPAAPELPTITHNEPILTGGSAGPPVDKLVRLLAACGYATNTVVKGENPHSILDNSVMSDVQRFWADHHISEPKDLFEGRDVAASDEQGKWVGPYTWQALKDTAAALVS